MIDLRLGDCLEVMKTIEDNSIDMILCDLPYGVTNCKWDILIPFDKLWEQYNRVLKINGACVLIIINMIGYGTKTNLQILLMLNVCL